MGCYYSGNQQLNQLCSFSVEIRCKYSMGCLFPASRAVLSPGSVPRHSILDAWGCDGCLAGDAGPMCSCALLPLPNVVAQLACGVHMAVAQVLTCKTLEFWDPMLQYPYHTCNSQNKQTVTRRIHEQTSKKIFWNL